MNRLHCEQKQIDEQIKILQIKLKEKSQALNQKQEMEDKLENELRFLRTNINELENVEYPPENEAEILVSMNSFFFNLFVYHINIEMCCHTHFRIKSYPNSKKI